MKRTDLNSKKPGLSWQKTITSRLFIGTTIFVAALTFMVSVLPAVVSMSDAESEPASTIILTVSILIMLLATFFTAIFCRFTVTVDERGLEVRSWLFNIPVKRISPEQIEKVEVTHLYPSEWGGWGYRIMVGRSAIILKSGSGLAITLKNQKEFGLTLENPEEPLQILQGFLESS